jgi:hypothetical protein
MPPVTGARRRAGRRPQGLDMLVLDLRGISNATDYFLIASGTSDMHVRSIAEHVIEELKKEGIGRATSRDCARALGAHRLHRLRGARVPSGGPRVLPARAALGGRADAGQWRRRRVMMPSHPLLWLRALLAPLCSAATAEAQYFGPQQGAVPRVRLPDHPHGKLRRLLLPAGARGGAGRGAHDRAVVRAAVAHAAARVPRAQAAHRVRVAHRLPADERAAGCILDESTGGVTEALKSRMILPFTGSYADFDHVLTHELVHGSSTT